MLQNAAPNTTRTHLRDEAIAFITLNLAEIGIGTPIYDHFIQHIKYFTRNWFVIPENLTL
jgi:hypothetical protein